jgi:hypothetical protein
MASLITTLTTPIEAPTDAHIRSTAEAAIVGGDAEIDAHIDARAAAKAGKGQRTDTIEPVLRGVEAQATTTAAFASNGVYLYHFRLDADFPVAKIAFYIAATTAGSVAFGLSTSADMATFTRVAHTGPLAAGLANTRTEYPLLTPPYICLAGVDYWFDFGLTDGTLTVPRLGMIAAIGLGQKTALVKTGAYSSGIPDTITGVAGHNAVPWFGLVS